MLREEIEQKIGNLRKKGRIISNCYTDAVVGMAEGLWTEGDSFLFSYDDHGVKRLVYFVLDTEQLKRLLERPDRSENGYVVEFLSRDRDENRRLMEDVGYLPVAHMKRLSNPNCGKILRDFPVAGYRDDSVGRLADVSEAGEVNRVLWSVFDTRISHLVNDTEFEGFIRNGEVSIHRGEDGAIDAVLQAVQQPCRFYINQVYNGTDKRVIHAMLQERLWEYVDAGGKYLYAWVEESNAASVKFHQKYGMGHDGMWDLVYVGRER